MASRPAPFWKWFLILVVGGFVVVCRDGFPPSREQLWHWAELVAIGAVAVGLVPVVDSLLRRSKFYRDLESRLGLNRDGRAFYDAPAVKPSDRD